MISTTTKTRMLAQRSKKKIVLLSNRAISSIRLDISNTHNISFSEMNCKYKQNDSKQKKEMRTKQKYIT